jgi:hypothetical protein
VEGQNIEPFIADIVIRPGETYTVNLIDVELRSALLLVTVSEPDATIIINGEALTEPGPAEVEFGEHIIRVEKDGFLPVEQMVTINRPFLEFPIELTRIALTARVIIYTVPSPAQIFIDNVFVGYSPRTREMETGTISVVARLEGHIDSSLMSWEILEGDNARTLLLSESNSDPFANLPPPDNVQPVETPPPPQDDYWSDNPWDFTLP